MIELNVPRTIRLEDLLGAEVVDADGASVGTVHDARFTADGPPLPSGLPSYRLAALVCGLPPVGRRLGYGGGEQAGPWPIARLFRALSRRSKLVDIGLVTAFDGRRVRLREVRDHLNLPGPHDD
jgi:hypothetical protein